MNEYDFLMGVSERIKHPLDIMMNDYSNSREKISTWCNADVVHDVDDLIKKGVVEIPVIGEFVNLV